MPQKSWLADVKTIYDLGQWCACRVDWDRDCVDEEHMDRKYKKLWAHHALGCPVAPKFHRYFHSALHDDWVLGQRRDKDFRLFVGCRWADRMHRMLCDKTETELPPTYYIEEIVLHKCHYARWAKSDGWGKLTFWKPEFDVDSFEQVNVAPTQDPVEDLSRDWFFTEHNRVQWIVELHLYRTKSPRGDGYGFGMFDCESVSVVDHRERQMVATWGEAVRPLWNAYAALPILERYPDNIVLPDIDFGALMPPATRKCT